MSDSLRCRAREASLADGAVGPSQRKACAFRSPHSGPVLECDLQPKARMTRSASAAAETVATVVPEPEYGDLVVRPDPAVFRVLVVDDNAENRALAKATLEDEDIPVVLA